MNVKIIVTVYVYGIFVFQIIKFKLQNVSSSQFKIKDLGQVKRY